MEATCGQQFNCVALSLACLIYDFQTLITGLIAIIVAIIAGIPVWRQLRDSNLQARISHRETLATLLRDSLQRYEMVEKSIGEPLSTAFRLTYDPLGEPCKISPEDAHYLEQILHGVLDWYLVVLAGTEQNEIEIRKTELRSALTRIGKTLTEAHWADHNDQHDDEHDFSDERWSEILAECEKAKIEASTRVSEVNSALQALNEAQHHWIQSLRRKIRKLDLQISSLD